MPKKKPTTVVEDPEPRINGFTEEEWHEISVLIGEAIEAEIPIRITLKSKLGDKVLEGVPFVKDSKLYLRSTEGSSVQVTLEQMAKVEEAVRY
ncbi:hypothetical protein [Alicyclobacillus sendaiensis]|uniref:Uncharacterized protein n=1 Tax=Alicyclobacillus sendaiensis PA2 TaxID=3029425 RepID=A0ABT6Y1N9_ALISE|nr:hypothetical protein [Alicyclobacillus sendaiensis]MDI9261268.1 hypothetical protein [Alicyclobacillus sendaiensis PA2]